VDTSAKISAVLPKREPPELCPPVFCFFHRPECKCRDFRRVYGTKEVLMYHPRTKMVFEIVYNPDQAMIGGLTIFGFAARISYLCEDAEISDNADELEAIGQEAIVAFLDYFMKKGVI
jgi:hypothetical protein